MKKLSSLISHLSSSKGFTLIELIIVIGILSVLSTVLIATLNPMAQFQKSNDAKRKSDLGQIQKVLEQYYQDNTGKYPRSSTISDTCGSPPTACPYRIVSSDAVNPVKEWGTAWTPYINVLPKDPNNSKKYVYYSSGGQSYYLYASLDRGSKDPQACSGTQCPNVPSGVKCGGSLDYCNYGVSSPNVSP